MFDTKFFFRDLWGEKDRNWGNTNPSPPQRPKKNHLKPLLFTHQVLSLDKKVFVNNFELFLISSNHFFLFQVFLIIIENSNKGISQIIKWLIEFLQKKNI